ncbi:small VCP/p97-interacting protein [Ctenocephalides felis]|uniref:small VCP/p97-interacting protein n=1 Tax=Ctenocephalides felis TaxID=7515 RepID=UPI000E6E52A6|nr:small VCP/p97-interacting protein [Ctenocephalides felis]
MGLCSSCFNPTSDEIPQPDMAIRRAQMAEAAEKRRIENESRGIKDIDKVRRQQQKAAELEKRQNEIDRQGGGGDLLRWQQD